MRLLSWHVPFIIATPWLLDIVLASPFTTGQNDQTVLQGALQDVDEITCQFNFLSMCAFGMTG